MKVSVRVIDQTHVSSFFYNDVGSCTLTKLLDRCSVVNQRERECNFSLTFTCILHQPKGPKPNRSTLGLGRYESVCG
jgi:hypothetical protein